MKLTVRDAVNRGYNLLACAILALAGLGFGMVVFDEVDWIDRVDDIGLLVVGALAVIWYLVGRNRFKRSVTPIMLSVLALLAQIFGVIFEHDDPGAFGDNIGGMFMLVPLLILLIVLYIRNRQLVDASEEALPAQPVSVTRK
jgi:hypothetical protein